jgi:hypothetical protein
MPARTLVSVAICALLVSCGFAAIPAFPHEEFYTLTGLAPLWTAAKTQATQVAFGVHVSYRNRSMPIDLLKARPEKPQVPRPSAARHPA